MGKRQMVKHGCKLIGTAAALLLMRSAWANDVDDQGRADEAAPFVIGLVAGKGMDDMLLQSGDIGSTDVLGADLRWQTDWQTAFDFAAVDAVYLNGQWARWEGEHEGAPDTLDVIALTVNWRWQPQRWFADAGVGFAHLSDTQHEEVNLSGANLFALDFAAGYGFENGLELSLRYRHYSNGYTDTPNPGLDVAVLLLSFGF